MSAFTLRNSEKYRQLRRKWHANKYKQVIENSHGNALLNDFLYDILNRPAARAYPLLYNSLRELAENVRPAVARNPDLIEVINRLTQPEELIKFEIVWTNEFGEVMTNKGWRCHYSTLLGPCRGGIRLHPTVNDDIVQCLALEYTLKNALLNMPMGGGLTASDFDARNATDYNVTAFAREFAIQIRKSIPSDWPVNISSDLGCGPRECKILDMAHSELINSQTRRPFPKVVGRSSATGFGAVEFAKRFLKLPSFDRTKCLISGCGDCALSLARNILVEGGRVMALSDSTGFLYVPEGITFVQWQRIADHRVQQTPLKDIVEDGWLKGTRWHAGSLWTQGFPCDYCFAAACEYEIDLPEAESIVLKSRAKAIIPISNMTFTPEASAFLTTQKTRACPNRATNLGSMMAVGVNLSEKVGRAEFEYRMKSFTHYVYDQCKSIYDEFYPDILFCEAVDMCSLYRLYKAFCEINQDDQDDEDDQQEQERLNNQFDHQEGNSAGSSSQALERFDGMSWPS